MPRKSVQETKHNVAGNKLRAGFERNVDPVFLETLDRDPTLSEELFFHRIYLGNEFREFITGTVVGARLERKCREMFVEASNALLSCNPADTKAIAEAQVMALAAVKVMEIVEEAISDGDASKMERATRHEDTE